MILVASTEKPLQHTQKATTRRGVCLKSYKAEIEGLYASQSDECPEDREGRGLMEGLGHQRVSAAVNRPHRR